MRNVSDGMMMVEEGAPSDWSRLLSREEQQNHRPAAAVLVRAGTTTTMTTTAHFAIIIHPQPRAGFPHLATPTPACFLMKVSHFSSGGRDFFLNVFP